MGKCLSEHRKPSELAVGKFRRMAFGAKFSLERVSPVSATHSSLWVLLRPSCLLTQIIMHGNTLVKDRKRTTGGALHPALSPFWQAEGPAQRRSTPLSLLPLGSRAYCILCVPPPPPPCTRALLSVGVCSVRGSPSMHRLWLHLGDPCKWRPDVFSFL